MEYKWKIRAYKEGDEEGIIKLTKLAFGWGDIKKWNWRYKDNPAGVGKIVVADDGGEIIGNGAFIPVKVKAGTDVVTAYISGDSVTHPGYRRQGIFEKLDSEKRSEAAKGGDYIAYRFPNKLAFPGAVKFGWTDVCLLNTYLKPLNLGNALKKYSTNGFLRKILGGIGNILIFILRRTHRPPKIGGLQVKKISSFDNRADELWKNVSKEHDIMVVKNKEYLNWKYVDMPESDFAIYAVEKAGQIHGYIILKCIKQPEGFLMGHISEIIASVDEPEIIHHLIYKAAKHFKEEKVDLVFYEMNLEKTYDAVLKKCGFISSRYFNKRHFCVYSSHPKITKAYLEDPVRWLIQRGDSTFGDSTAA